MERVLLVEDDERMAKLIRDSLRHSPIPLTWSTTLTKAYEYVNQQVYDLVIVDRKLPDGDGLELVHYLHEAHAQTRICIVSSSGLPSERVKGLQAGADEYLPKPFAVAELTLRLEKLSRVVKLPPAGIYTVGPHVFRQNTHGVTLGDTPLALRPQEVRLLYYLLQHRNIVVTKEMIRQHLWPDLHELHPSTIPVYIRRVRQALGPHGYLIRSLRGQGVMVCDQPQLRVSSQR
jgi:two-component system, OmpR family, response regulator